MTDGQLSLFEDRGGRGADRGAGPPAAAIAADPDAAARDVRARSGRTTSCSRPRPGPARRSVLVTRYVNLLTRGVDPANILAITFTRKAAAEMRERIIRELRARRGAVDVRSRALDGDPRSARRHPDQHHRRVLPVAAARVSARGRPRSRLRDGRRDRGAAAGRAVARHVARASSSAWRSASRTSRWCWRSSGCRARARGSRICCSGGSSPGTCSIASSRAGPRTSTPTRSAGARSTR